MNHKDPSLSSTKDVVDINNVWSVIEILINNDRFRDQVDGYNLSFHTILFLMFDSVSK